MSNSTNNNETKTGYLCEWEENGYHDSDGYAARWDGEKVVLELVWTTRGCMEPKPSKLATAEECELARRWLADQIFGILRKGEDAAVLEPDNVNKGDDVVLLKGHTFNDKKAGTKTKVEAGTTGRVFWIGAFGSFYRNGYNRPNRSNRRVGLELTDGRRIFCPLSKVRLARDVATDAELREKAERLSYDAQFGKVLSSKHAWDTSNHAAAVLQEARAKAAS